ncbi:hypothetical protein [Streptomyces sp. V3I7]|uniref:SCO2400 family protein n=1 Tax=Streptomyces sp. V3I7 TaxID=3042278 RepID=UPI00277D7150|nr:hypothetical protein [Streptomyces sp. V3I7]MDQ0990663.1 pyruvate/2-oxoglutarate dehydrogenase complex dihydrolipoamide acyltransferase (E2) component [Streptomyces sp. V3I7]
MDYCHPCRRHLNGALACPGCGTPIEELRPHRRDAPHDGHQADDQAPYQDEYAYAGDGEADEEEDGEDEPGGGRAARRREQGRGRGRSRGGGAGAGADASRRDRKAAVHRRRRRRTLLITAGFVLATGALSIAELGMDATPFAGSGPAVAEDRPRADGASPSVTGATARPGKDAASGSADTSRSVSPDASASASASASPKETASATPATGDKGPQGQTVPPRTGPATPPPATATAAPPPAPTTQQPTSAPSPEPSQTRKCFLWWCG